MPFKTICCRTEHIMQCLLVSRSLMCSIFGISLPVVLISRSRSTRVIATSVEMSYAWLKRMFLDHVFCPFVLFTNPSRAGYVFTHYLRRARFLSFDINTIAKMRRKPQHLGNISSDVPYMLRFSSHFCNGFYIKRQKRGAT